MLLLVMYVSVLELSIVQTLIHHQLQNNKDTGNDKLHLAKWKY